jgi:O-succinylbenzoic acid--CoA ligase
MTQLHSLLSLLSIEAAAREVPDRLAVITRDRQLTFAEAAAHAARLPGGPRLDPAAPQHATPLLAARTLDTVLSIYAALEHHRPLGLIHPQQPERTRDHTRAALAKHAVPSDTAVVLFTSGSTGTPRGVVLPRRALQAAALAHAHHLPWRDDDRWLVALPLAHSGGLAAAIRCLAARRPVVLVEETSSWPLATALAASATTLTSLGPTQLISLLDDSAWQPPPSLRAVLVGGAACPPALRRRAAARGVPILVTYGMTETFGQIATAPIAAPDPVSDPDSAVGPALLGVTLVAGTRTRPAPIEIRGDVCMTGYLGEPPLPTPRIVTNDDGWLDSHNVLHVVGRRDDIIITGGTNVSPLTVEEDLRQTPGVVDACVFAIPDPRWGQLVAAALVTTSTFSLAAALAHWATLPAHHRPRALHLLPCLPLNATGKVDRRAVVALPDPIPVTYP